MVFIMSGVIQDDARLHKYCRDGKLEKIKVVKIMHMYHIAINDNRYIYIAIFLLFIGLCKHS